MAKKTTIGIQPYIKGHKGKLTKGTLLPADNAEQATQRATRGVEAGAFLGAVVFSVEYDEAADFAEDPVLIASLGQVPDMATA